MYFDRDEFALLSRGGRVPRPKRFGPSMPPLPEPRRPRRSMLVWARGRARAVRAERSGVRAGWSAYGESRDR
jgi:hypothetical protein